MNKLVIFLFLLTISVISLTQTANAGGDKVRGDEGEGDVIQVQMMGEDPWNG